MTPSEVIQQLLGLGICYQLTVEQQPTVIDRLEKLKESGEDFTKLGFNQEEEPEKEKPKTIWDRLQVVTDEKVLKQFGSWYLASTPPEKITEDTQGPMLIASVDDKRRLIVKGDDVPFAPDGIKHVFCCEYINQIDVKDDYLLVNTLFGNTAISIPPTVY